MKNIILLSATLLFQSAFSQNNFWENPALVDEGKEPARTFFIPASQVQELTGFNNFHESKNIQMLNGTWKFNFVEKVADRTVEFYKTSFDDSNWKNIQVPGSWEMQRFGVPVYTNISYIFPENPPFVDNEDLPIGTYRKVFTVNENLSDKEIILHFGSIAGAATIYVNEKKAGYSKASKTPAEFNITPYLQKGENLLAVQVFKWSDASYLEDQDFWRLAGIERDVFLISRPAVSIEDFCVVADLDANYQHGQLKMDIKVRSFTTQITGKHSVTVTMLDNQQKKVFSKSLAVNAINAKEMQTVSLDEKVSNPEKWSAEFPNLYTVTIELKDDSGKTLEAAQCNTGFRKMEIKNNQVLINGKPIIIRGTNIHEHHEKFGHYVDYATKVKDIALMKKHNINAIRTSHYPQSPEVYELCDKYGIYVVDEANIEAHGLDGMAKENHPSFRDDWKGQHLDRTIRMFERDKNHPCVIIWSLGNESDFGPNYEATYNWLKQNDKAKRPVQCERADGNAFTDIMVPMYPSPDWIEKYATDSNSHKPFIMCEYAHSMGNSTGNFQEYWDIIMKYPILQGGFIWDWVDQGLEAQNFEGKKYWLYGGDLGGYRWTHDENFCNNGLINADRAIHPALNEVKKVYQPIWFKAVDVEKGKFLFHNYNLFTNLNAYDYIWKLYENGKPVDSSVFAAEGKPLSEKEVTLKLPIINQETGSEFFLVIEARQRLATDLIEKGHVIATEQFAFPKNNYFVTNISNQVLKIAKTDRDLHFESGGGKWAISLKSGKLYNYSYKGTSLITGNLRTNFWRAPIDNDFGNNMPSRLNIWRAADNNMVLKGITVDEQNDTGVVVVASYRFLNLDVFYSIKYTILNDASVIIASSFDLGTTELPELPRFGMKMQLPLELENVSYYGRGPWENYSDRNTSSFIGNYTSKVSDLNFDYSRPQENGYRTDVRTVSFTDSTGFGLVVEGINTPVCFNARNNSDEDFDPGLTKKQQHPVDVPKRKSLYVNIDFKQMGVGGNDSWGALPLDKYRLMDKKYEYSFLIRPVKL
ncbi:MAG TPA: beta-galactosidase [Marinilabiliales bacterium]|nr:beta-galactosidase [Marinilabiliales bacterium]